ncbi:hypothetical protein C5S29_01580 [ANME-1 cluster archaeon GoMg3.2]|nr:hypothetical protein [ANME-1 cluster archaeon GoMg3.2]
MIRDYFSEVENFPFHSHTPEGVRECDKVNLIEVIGLVKALMSKCGN